MNTEQKRFVVLFAEDNDDDVWLLTRALGWAGLEVEMHRAKDGKQTLEYLAGKGKFADRKRFPIPMVLVLDLTMPGLDGLDVIQWVRTQTDLVALPILVASDRSAQARLALRAGANWFAKKHWAFKELTRLVGLLKAFWNSEHWEGRPQHN